MAKEKPTKEQLEQWHSDPKNWKLGILYINLADKRIMVPKRHKILGWTFNWGNPISILVFVGMCVGFFLFFHFTLD